MADSRYISAYCEINVAHHCNLSCRGCSHLSPVSPKEYVRPEALKEDLRRLAQGYRAERVRLIGGEPLLHPNLAEVIRTVRGSGIARWIVIATNGTLLPKQDDLFWSCVDEVEVTLYPGERLSAAELWKCRRRAKRYGVQLRVSFADRFRESHSEAGTGDARLVKRIYDTCLIAHRWSCHTIEDGHFFKCPQASRLPRLLDSKLVKGADGIALGDGPELGKQVREYLESETPLEACRHCLGSAGKLFSHEQVTRSEFRSGQAGTTESLLDVGRLEALEREMGDGDTHSGFRLETSLDFLKFLPRLLSAGA